MAESVDDLATQLNATLDQEAQDKLKDLLEKQKETFFP